MTSEPRTPASEETIDELHARVRQLEAVVIAARAVVLHGEPDYRARCDAAAAGLRQLIETADQRPGSCSDELRAILRELEGGGR